MNTILHKLASCSNDSITLQSCNKAVGFNLTWDEFLMPEYVRAINKDQVFFLGTYYSHNKRDMLNLTSKLSRDSEVADIKKLILTEIRGGNYLLLDVKTNKLETVSIKFIMTNLQLLEDFTAIQCFFLGIRAGSFYDKNSVLL